MNKSVFKKKKNKKTKGFTQHGCILLITDNDAVKSILSLNHHFFYLVHNSYNSNFRSEKKRIDQLHDYESFYFIVFYDHFSLYSTFPRGTNYITSIFRLLCILPLTSVQHYNTIIKKYK